jgi:hypothetical protein
MFIHISEFTLQLIARRYLAVLQDIRVVRYNTLTTCLFGAAGLLDDDYLKWQSMVVQEVAF